MKKVIFLFLFLFIVSFAYCNEGPTAIVFYSPNCKVCLKLKKDFLPQIEQKYKNQLEWQYLNTAQDPESLSLLMSVTEQFGGEGASVPAILVGNSFLVGNTPIRERLDEAIVKYLKEKKKPLAFLRKDLVDLFRKFSVFAIMGSGLIDGINPCAFAVIVFFISFLAVYGYRRREIILIGTSYCLAVFITYLLIGLGIFKFLYSIEYIYFLIKGFYYLVALFCFTLGILALYDYFKFKKTGSSDETILQLPKFLKKRINLVIGSKMREKQKGIFGLVVASFVVGFLVSLLEAVCTGQVYLPTIVFILKNTDLKLKALSYLLLYNFMFILPLVVIFLLSLLGVSSAGLSNFLKKNLGRIKILLAVVFIGLGILILSLN